MVNTLRVMLWDEEIGRLAWDDRRRLSYFTYNPEFLKKGIDVSPLQAPVRGIRAMTPVWGEDAKMYQKLPAFLEIRCRMLGVISFSSFGEFKIIFQMLI